MIFIAYVESFNEVECKEEFDRIVLTAKNFTSAVKKIEKYFGTSLSQITRLESICDTNIIFIDEDTEDGIRNNEYNQYI